MSTALTFGQVVVLWLGLVLGLGMILLGAAMKDGRP